MSAEYQQYYEQWSSVYPEARQAVDMLEELEAHHSAAVRGDGPSLLTCRILSQGLHQLGLTHPLRSIAKLPPHEVLLALQEQEIRTTPPQRSFLLDISQGLDLKRQASKPDLSAVQDEPCRTDPQTAARVYDYWRMNNADVAQLVNLYDTYRLSATLAARGDGVGEQLMKQAMEQFTQSNIPTAFLYLFTYPSHPTDLTTPLGQHLDTITSLTPEQKDRISRANTGYRLFRATQSEASRKP